MSDDDPYGNAPDRPHELYAVLVMDGAPKLMPLDTPLDTENDDETEND